MKKLLLSVLFILSISPLLAMVGTNVPIKADEIVIGGNSYVEDVITQSEYNRLNYSGLLAEFLKQGGTIDTTNINPDYGVDDVIEEIGETIYEVIRDTGQFVDWLGDSIFQSEGTVYPENIKPRMNNTLADNMGVFLGLIPLLNTQVADLPIPVPDENYQTYIDTINGTGFYFKEYPITNYSSYGTVNFGPNYDYSFCAPNVQNSDSFNNSFPQMFVSDIVSINIVPDGDNYKIDQTISFIQPLGTRNNANMYYYAPYKNVSGDKYYVLFDGSHPSDLRYQYTGSLAGCFQYLAYKFRNINIYVNGDLWAYVGSGNNYQITLNPTTITPVDEHGRVRWKYDEEIYIDIDLLWQLIDDLLNDPDRRIIRFSDIEDAIVDENGQTAIAVKVVNDEDNVDEYYIKNYGSLIPVFPTDVSFPVSIDKMVSIVTVPVSVIPDDLMGVLKTLFIGTLMVCLLQRLLE